MNKTCELGDELVVGHSFENPPYFYINEEGVPAGMNAEILKDAAASLHCPLRYVKFLMQRLNGSFPLYDGAVLSGDVMLAAEGTQFAKEDANKYLFSDPVYSDEVVVVTQESEIVPGFPPLSTYLVFTIGAALLLLVSYGTVHLLQFLGGAIFPKRPRTKEQTIRKDLFTTSIAIIWIGLAYAAAVYSSTFTGNTISTSTGNILFKDMITGFHDGSAKLYMVRGDIVFNETEIRALMGTNRPVDVDTMKDAYERICSKPGGFVFTVRSVFSTLKPKKGCKLTTVIPQKIVTGVDNLGQLMTNPFNVHFLISKKNGLRLLQTINFLLHTVYAHDMRGRWIPPLRQRGPVPAAPSITILKAAPIFCFLAGGLLGGFVIYVIEKCDKKRRVEVFCNKYKAKLVAFLLPHPVQELEEEEPPAAASEDQPTQSNQLTTYVEQASTML